jgi:hypothetical protein
VSKRLFDKKVKEVIYNQMEKLGGEIKQEDVIFIINPYIESEIDVKKLKDQYRKRIANNLMARFRDDIGIRDCFVVQDGSGSKYVNVDRTKNIKDLKAINVMLKNKINGLTASKSKVNKKYHKLLGQISFDELAEKINSKK